MFFFHGDASMRRLSIWLPLTVLLACGCTGDNSKPGMAAFASNRNVTNKPPENLPAASLAASTRVDSLGRQILAANPDIGVRPLFITIGVADLTVFHSGDTHLFISEGVVNKCKVDGAGDPELAAVICSELGRMVAEAQQQKASREPMNRELPYQPRVGSGTVGSTDPTFTQQAELGLWEKDNPRTRTVSSAPGTRDPKELARCYLTKAGFGADQLDKIAPVLRIAEANPIYEKQLAPQPSSGGIGAP